MGLPDGDGLEFIRAEKASIGAEVIVITGQASVDSAVEALREGVLDYLVKPVDRARLKAVLATTSLPLPLSPVMNTVTAVPDTRRICS